MYYLKIHCNTKSLELLCEKPGLLNPPVFLYNELKKLEGGGLEVLATGISCSVIHLLITLHVL